MVDRIAELKSLRDKTIALRADARAIGARDISAMLTDMIDEIEDTIEELSE